MIQQEMFKSVKILIKIQNAAHCHHHCQYFVVYFKNTYEKVKLQKKSDLMHWWQSRWDSRAKLQSLIYGITTKFVDSD